MRHNESEVRLKVIHTNGVPLRIPFLPVDLAESAKTSLRGTDKTRARGLIKEMIEFTMVARIVLHAALATTKLPASRNLPSIQSRTS
jgi:hypothetical protein